MAPSETIEEKPLAGADLIEAVIGFAGRCWSVKDDVGSGGFARLCARRII